MFSCFVCNGGLRIQMWKILLLSYGEMNANKISYLIVNSSVEKLKNCTLQTRSEPSLNTTVYKC